MLILAVVICSYKLLHAVAVVICVARREHITQFRQIGGQVYCQRWCRPFSCFGWLERELRAQTVIAVRVAIVGSVALVGSYASSALKQ